MDSAHRRRSDAPPDADVIARVLDGDSEQFATLVARYQQWLYRHAVSMVLDHDTAAEMVQDAFIRAYSNLRGCRDPRRFRAWVFQTLRHRCLDHLKEPRRRNVPLEHAERLVDSGDDPAVLAERGQLRARIVRALAQLPVEQREAFVMHYVDDVPYDAMAELLDVSVSALKMRALRARERLSALLRPADVTPAPSASSLVQTR